MKLFIHILLSITTAWLAWNPAYAACRVAELEASATQVIMPCHEGSVVLEAVMPQADASPFEAESACQDNCASVCHFAGLLLPVVALSGLAPTALDLSDPVRAALPSHAQRLLRPPSSLPG